MTQPPEPPVPPEPTEPNQPPPWAEPAPEQPAAPPPVPPPPYGPGQPHDTGQPHGGQPYSGQPYGDPSGAPGWAAPGPAATPRRFSGVGIALGILAAVLGIPTLTSAVLSTLATLDGNGAPIVGAALLVGAVLPLVLGIVLVARGAPNRRGFGLGLLIGWGGVVVVGGGLCIAIITALSNGGTSP